MTVETDPVAAVRPRRGRRSPSTGVGSAIALLGLGLASLDSPPALRAQDLLRKATTLEALNTHGLYFHGQPIIVRAETWIREDATWVADGETRMLVVGDALRGYGDGESVELVGTLWDVGRLDPEDPRMAGYDLDEYAVAVFGRAWPNAGELLVIESESVENVSPQAMATIRSIALEPARYVGEAVSLSGRFRGRNLFGDLPQSPGISLTDFVLQSGNAAVWITGIEPKGEDFELDPGARVDTGRWLQVEGTVRMGNGLVWLEGSSVEAAEPPATTTAADVAVRRLGPPPEVIFSAPVQDDFDIALDTSVRLQFSRDMDPSSFGGLVAVGYLGVDGPALEFELHYFGANRVLEIRFAEPLEPFRTVQVEIREGMKAFDGAEMPEPWQLRFSLGS